MRIAVQSLAMAALALLGSAAAAADVEATDAGGRRVLLKDDGTWRLLEPTAAASAASAPAVPAVPAVPAELLLERRVDAPGGCRFEIVLQNKLPFEIRSLVPDFAIYRGDEVVYMTQMAGFGPVRPGDRHRRALQFPGVGCADISRLQVQGGDRCEMGELNKFTEGKGLCLAQVRVQASELLRFDK